VSVVLDQTSWAYLYISRVAEDPNAAEVVKIATGQLFLVRPENIRSSKECMYVALDLR
jgi:hypothetical protein